MNAFAFALVAGFYFWIGPVVMILLTQWLVNTRRTRYIALTIACLALISWGVTALLTYCVQQWAPEVLPEEVLKVAYRFGWSYLFITSMPAVVLYCIATCAIRPSRKRLSFGFALASVPYVLMLCWWLPRMIAR